MSEIELKNTRTMNVRLLLQDFEVARRPNPNHTTTPFSIINYAKEPLPSLLEACAPLVGIVDHIFEKALAAMTATPNEPPNGLTRDESASIRLYTMEWADRKSSLYYILNETLHNKDQENLHPWFKYLKLFLTALVKIPCAPAQTVWRGIQVDVRVDFPSESDVIWWRFSSCTTKLSVLQNSAFFDDTSARTLFSIEAFNGRDVSGHSYFKNEDEVLLLPGTCMEVLPHLTQGSGLTIIPLKQKIPAETLLEPPFKGARLYPKPERSWYRRKRFSIPISLLTVLLLATAIVLSAIFATRSRSTLSQNITRKSSLAMSPILMHQPANPSCSQERKTNRAIDSIVKDLK